MTAFTARVATGPIDHPNSDQARKLAAIASRLGRTHALAYCGGCDWYLRYPVRGIDRLHAATWQHLGSAHMDALVDGRACIDPDLADGGDEWLRSRLRMTRRAS